MNSLLTLFLLLLVGVGGAVSFFFLRVRNFGPTDYRLWEVRHYCHSIIVIILSSVSKEKTNMLCKPRFRSQSRSVNQATTVYTKVTEADHASVQNFETKNLKIGKIF